MACATKLVTDIVNGCNAVKGLKSTAYWMYRKDIVIDTETNTVSNVNALEKGIIQGLKTFINAGNEVVTSEIMANGFKHKFTAIFNVKSTVIDEMDDIVVFVQSNSGQWLCYGAEYGLYKTSQSAMSNDNNGTIAVEFSSLEGMEEEYSEYVGAPDITDIPSVSAVANNTLTAINIAKMILSAHSIGKYNGVLDVSGGTNATYIQFISLDPPYDDTAFFIAVLESRGWTITYNS